MKFGVNNSAFEHVKLEQQWRRFRAVKWRLKLPLSLPMS